MREDPAAIGYLRADISGPTAEWDRALLRSAAAHLGYEYLRTVVLDAGAPDPLAQLVELVRALDLDAVVVPSRAHLGGQIPEALVKVADVITLTPPQAHARWATGRVDTAPDVWSPPPHSTTRRARTGIENG